MTGRRFFAIIWRVNAVVLLAFGLLGVGVLGTAALLFYKDSTRTRHAEDVARLNIGGDITSEASLGRFEALPRTTVLRAPLRVVQSFALGSGSKDASSIRNYLFYEPDTRATRWLKPSMDSLIIQTWAVPENESNEDPSRWVASIYAIVSSDTSGDGALTDSDQIQITSSKPDLISKMPQPRESS